MTVVYEAAFFVFLRNYLTAKSCEKSGEVFGHLCTNKMWNLWCYFLKVTETVWRMYEYSCLVEQVDVWGQPPLCTCSNHALKRTFITWLFLTNHEWLLLPVLCICHVWSYLLILLWIFILFWTALWLNFVVFWTCYINKGGMLWSAKWSWKDVHISAATVAGRDLHSQVFYWQFLIFKKRFIRRYS